MKQTRKRIFRIFFILVSIVLLLGVIGVVILYTQQQRLTNMAVSELNKQLPGELVIEGSEISPFQNFPYVSIGLRNVRFYANKQRKGRPLYEMERLYVGFSLPDVLREKYNVKVLFLKNGHLDMVRELNGNLNLVEANRIKQDTLATTESSSGSLALDVKKIVLKNMDISFYDRTNGQRLSTHIDKIKTALHADDKEINGTLHGGFIVDVSSPSDTVLFRHKKLEANIKVSYNTEKQFLTISPSQLKIEAATLKVWGTADLLHGDMVDLRVTGDRPDLNLLFAFAPQSVGDELKRFNYDGRIYFNGTIKGKFAGGQLPQIAFSFGCEDAWFLNKDANKKLDQLEFKGYYTNGAAHSLKTSELHLLNMNARPDKGTFKGNFVMRDFTDPKIIMQIDSELELEFIGAFLGIKDLERITGHISLKMDFKEMVDLSLPEASMSKLKEGIQSELTVKDLTFRIPGYPHIVRNLDLHANMKNGSVTLDSLACKFGNSDFFMNGALSDLPALFHQHQKPVTITLNARSNKMILKELLAFDTTMAAKVKEEINGFNIGLSLETSVQQLLHPAPLPKGKFHMEKLYAGFKIYPHAFHDFGADLTINDTALLLKNFGGKIDSSDLRLSARVIHYQLWFDKVMRGRTQVAFDLKSDHLAMNDLLSNRSRQFIPADYQHEVGSGLWLRAKMDMKYDSVFRFAKLHIANISGALKVHPIKLDSIKGTIKYGANKFIAVDTLTGKIGRSDFDLSMRLFTGKDTTQRKKANFLQFTSKFLDVDELTNYSFSNTPTPEAPLVQPAVVRVTDSSHSKAFNIFSIPFTAFTAKVNIGKVKYHKLWLKNITTSMRMQADQHLYIDTLGMNVAEGRIGMRGHFNGSNPKKIYFRSRIRVEDVNIEKMMLKLDNFGQDLTINKNIKGRLSGQIKSRLLVHPDLTPIINDSEAQLDVHIYNGSLIDFAPMQAMAGYFKDKNLRNVRFDTLRNKLTLKNGVLEIPTMNINSSLGFIEISGKQYMDMSMEYYLRIPLKLVTQVGFKSLFGKKQEEVDPDQVDAIEYRDKDKKVRFMNIKVSGTPDKFKVGLGKAKKA
ncbi:AsmA-like C-terminal region [Chitinophaga sp. CF118]|uniref:AsmA-like C-terminal region-containing protein n=1 Tax=Chitinophaga sp. CF118 TaxID=1884367 RepID=UPI0008E8CF44|nr:AsmA-like C-terminal region-containing protein [Chitinophaga sp. CF118]SFE02101.1 AsmA-like C-terminal region [Chitinophaga sp. CF118]